MNSKNGSQPFPPMQMARSVGHLAQDITTLMELQAKLLKLDARDCVKNLIAPVALFVTTLVVLLGCVPVFLFAVAYGFKAMGLAEWAAFAAATGAGLLLAAILGLVAWLLLRKVPAAFDRSKEEWSRNVHWFKRSLKHSK